MIRLVHLSDIHLTTSPLGWKGADWLNKRLAAWANLRLLGRGYRFRHADQVMARLVQDLASRSMDHLVFSGDATALGFANEMVKAARLLGVGTLPGIAVPGNHDYCTPAAARSGHFENYFGPWQTGERIGAHVYPFAQRVGHVWLVAVNSATGNRLAWDAGGGVGPDQRDRLGRLLARLEPGPRLLITHYPLCLANGKREVITHGLRDVDEVVAVAAAGGVGLWLHGHRHHHYYFQTPPNAPFPVICGGSSTQSHLWSYGEYAIDGQQVHVTRRVYDPGRNCFQDAESYTLKMP